MALLCAVLLLPAQAPAGPGESATSALQDHLDRVLAVVQTPGFLARDREERRADVRRVMNDLFDWPALARRALGQRWDLLSPSQHQRFTDEFARLVERIYMWKVDRYDGKQPVRDPIRYLDETATGRATVVHTILAVHHDVPVDFQMARRGTHWKIEDIRVLGVSVTENYRAQFDRFSLGRLLDRITAKVRGGEDEDLLASPAGAK